MEKIADAAKPLYDGLDDAQKHRFGVLLHEVFSHQTTAPIGACTPMNTRTKIAIANARNDFWSVAVARVKSTLETTRKACRAARIPIRLRRKDNLSARARKPPRGKAAKWILPSAVRDFASEKAIYASLFHDVTRTSTDIPRNASTGPSVFGYRHCLPDVARDGDGDQIKAANAAVGWIESDPTRAGHINLRPGMGRPQVTRTSDLLIRIIEIARDHPRPESQTARRFNEKDREIPTGSLAAVQSLGRRLGPLVVDSDS